MPQVNAGLPYHSNRQNVLWSSLVNTSRADSIYTAHYFNTQSLNFSALPPPSSAASTQDGPNMAQLQAQANVYADLSQLSDAPNCPWYVLICGLACCMLHAACCTMYEWSDIRISFPPKQKGWESLYKCTGHSHKVSTVCRITNSSSCPLTHAPLTSPPYDHQPPYI